MPTPTLQALAHQATVNAGEILDRIDLGLLPPDQQAAARIQLGATLACQERLLAFMPLTAEAPPAFPPDGRLEVVLEPLPDPVPADQRLKRFLKAGGRAYGLRVLSVRPLVPPTAAPVARSAPEPAAGPPGGRSAV